MKKTLTGPQGLSLVLDSAEIFPDDPGQGTPAMVHLGRYSATYSCAADTGELECGEKELTISQAQWLRDQQGEVWDFLEAHGG